MKTTSKILKNTVIITGFVLLLAVAASANSADQSIWFQHPTMSQASDLGSGPTCSFSASAGENIYLRNQVQTTQHMAQDEPLTLCSVTVLPGDSIWFRR
jgi:hypothetical protein